MSTFRQTLNLYKSGQRDDVLAGCDYILKMDGSFDPAKKLMDKMNNPNLPIDVDSLMPGGGPLADARAALAAREFQRAIDLCSEILAQDPSNTDAQQIGAAASERMEAAPFVDQFVTSCRSHIGNANESAARTALEKARSLDPDHPAIAELEMELSAISGAPAAAPPIDFGASFGASSDASNAFSFGAPSSSSFVVDNPPAPEGSSPSHSSAPASDFGFTFEEDKPAASPGGFSFDPTPSAAAPAEPAFSFGAPAEVPVGEANTFDFAAGGVEVSADDAARISSYLSEGDNLFENGEYANAIDTWSRIFLIDVTNEQASERIERARSKRLEKDQEVEDLMIAATLAFEKKDFPTARTKFEEILRIDPANFNASEYLEKLSDTAGLAARPAAPAKGAPDVLDDFGMEDEAPAAASAAPRAAAKPAKAAAPAAESRPSKLPMIAAIAVAAIVLLAGGWFGYTKFFGATPGMNEAQTRATFNKAQSLADAGKFDQAIQLLTKVSSPENPQHERALEMIADLQKKKGERSGRIGGRPTADVFNERIAAGRAAFESRDYVAAKDHFDKAAEIQKDFPPDIQTMYENASQQVAKLDSAMVFFKEGNYAEAVLNLESLLQQDPANANVRQLLLNAHFNLGVLALQEERTQDALAEFGKVLAENPNDELAKRSRDLAERYDGESKDLLYKIFVRYLAFR